MIQEHIQREKNKSKKMEKEKGQEKNVYVSEGTGRPPVFLFSVSYKRKLKYELAPTEFIAALSSQTEV